MPGSVMRRNVCHRLAPSVWAACSWSSPISSRTGTMARTTSGSDTKMVASTMPGSEKMTWKPCRSSQPPTVEKCPYTRMSARPTTTGETASGRSISALTIRLPGNRWRTSSTAMPTPKTVLASTDHTATEPVTSNAWIALGVQSAAKNLPAPCSNVRHTTRPTGRTSSRSRYASARNRSGSLATAGAPALDQVEPDQHDERDGQQQGRHGGGADRVVALDPAEDVHGRDLGLEREAAGEQVRRAVLGDRPGE